MQIVSAITTFDLNINTEFSIWPDIMGSPVEQMSYSLDCFLVNVKREIPIVYLRIIWSLIMPIYYYLIFYVFFKLMEFYERIKHVRSNITKRLIFTTAIFLYIYMQPSLVF